MKKEINLIEKYADELKICRFMFILKRNPENEKVIAKCEEALEEYKAKYSHNFPLSVWRKYRESN